MRRIALLFLAAASLWGGGDVVPWQSHFEAIAGAQWPWRAAQVKAESNFKTGAVSPVGARGAAQFMPKTWAWAIEQGWAGAKDTPHDLVPSLKAQHAYMSWLSPRVGHDKDMATGAYNCGLGNVQKADAHAKRLGLQGAGAWLRALPAIIKQHAAETQGYVKRINAFEADIRQKAQANTTNDAAPEPQKEKKGGRMANKIYAALLALLALAVVYLAAEKYALIQRVEAGAAAQAEKQELMRTVKAQADFIAKVKVEGAAQKSRIAKAEAEGKAARSEAKEAVKEILAAPEPETEQDLVAWAAEEAQRLARELKEP
jgi:soluble lytic murein transglycosylase-like protein